MDRDQKAMNRCGGCGLEVVGGTAGCHSIRDELLALHFSEATYFGVHRLFVDIYCLQHPDEGCVSFKSLAAHLAHLCWSLEFNGTRAVPSEAIRRWVERHPHLEKPALPERRGRMTVADVAKAENPAAHHQAVEQWARSTWDAYADLQSTARHWVTLAYEGDRAGRVLEQAATRVIRRQRPAARRHSSRRR
jgi:hypothetical protein